VCGTGVTFGEGRLAVPMSNRDRSCVNRKRALLPTEFFGKKKFRVKICRTRGADNSDERPEQRQEKSSEKKHASREKRE